MLRPWLIATLTAFLALLALGGSAPSGDRNPPSHTVLVVLENHEYGEVVGNSEAPFLNGLADRGTLLTHYYAITHPSLPNYLALLGGSTFGVDDNCTECSARGSNLALQLARAGISWRAYFEDMPHRCFGGEGSGGYVKRHNPFMYFPSIASEPQRCKEVVPLTRLETDLRRDTLPALAWVTPNLCHDAHDCGIGTADNRLSKLVPRLTRRLGPDGLLIVTFDEGTTNRGCCRLAAGGHVPTILVGADVRAGERVSPRYDHYSLLATLEDRFGLPRLRHARGARPLAAAFR